MTTTDVARLCFIIKILRLIFNVMMLNGCCFCCFIDTIYSGLPNVGSLIEHFSITKFSHYTVILSGYKMIKRYLTAEVYISSIFQLYHILKLCQLFIDIQRALETRYMKHDVIAIILKFDMPMCTT